MRVYASVIVAAALLGTACGRRDYPVVRTPAGPAPISTNSRDAGVIPAGTVVEVRTNEDIRGDSAAQGRSYSAEIARDIVNSSGSILVPKGSQAQLIVANFREGGRVTGDRVDLRLQSVTVNGRNFQVQSATSGAGDRGLGKNQRTAEMVGGGAALGTLIGAVAGGGKGAAIGALAGAAAGAAAQVITKNKDLRIPAESVLTFRLEEPIRLL